MSTLNAASYSFTTLQFRGAVATHPVAISGDGLVAGYFVDSGLTAHGFTYSEGGYAQVDAGGTCTSTFVTGVNTGGLLSGYCFPSQGGAMAFFGEHGKFKFFSAESSLDTYGEGINDISISVGWFITNSNTVASYVAEAPGNPYRFFTAPGSSDTAAYSIADSNEIVGSGTPGNGGLKQGFIEKGGTFTFYQDPSAYAIFFNGVNNSALVVGD